MSKIFLAFFLVLALALTSFSPVVAMGKTNQNQARLKICQTREAQIKKRVDKIVNVAENQLENFDQKTKRITDYYSQKLVPAGVTVPKYGDLVNDIQTKKTAVQNSLSKARAEAVNFSCNNGEPQKSIQDFRKYTQETNTALNQYRLAVKNLLVAVRTASVNN